MTENNLRKSERLLKLIFNSKFWIGASRILTAKLTVLNYHRVENPEGDKVYFKPNISASPKMFGSQLEYLTENFNVISLSQLVDWLSYGANLPPNAALITFDDGYLDNYTEAYPQLKKRNLPAVIFLTTSHIGESEPFYWDLIAYCFQNTNRDSVSLSKLGEFRWETTIERNNVCSRVIEGLKRISDNDKKLLVESMINRLGVSIPRDEFSNLFLTWDHVRELIRGGIEMGSHTVNHPILTRIHPQEAIQEMEISKQIIENQIDQEIVSIAYPNGQENDFNRGIMLEAERLGYKTGFSLVSGPQSYREIKINPYSIRRVFISHRDTIYRFAAKIHGLPRILEILGKGMG